MVAYCYVIVSSAKGVNASLHWNLGSAQSAPSLTI